MRLPDGEEVDVRLPLLGRQNVANALAAAAAAQAVGASTDDIVAGPRAARRRCAGGCKPLPGRGGATIIDDSYNANPGSVRAALDYLAVLGGTRILVLGNMAELGPAAPALHRGDRRVRARPLRLLFAIGELASEAAQASARRPRAFADIEAARAALDPLLAPNVTVLVKGSRVMGLDRLVQGARGRRAESDAS